MITTLFTTSPASKLAAFKTQAENAYSVFTKAMNDLIDTNAKISAEVVATEQQMKDLAIFNENLNTQKSANEKVIGRIKAIVED